MLRCGGGKPSWLAASGRHSVDGRRTGHLSGTPCLRKPLPPFPKHTSHHPPPPPYPLPYLPQSSAGAGPGPWQGPINSSPVQPPPAVPPPPSMSQAQQAAAGPLPHSPGSSKDAEGPQQPQQPGASNSTASNPEEPPALSNGNFHLMPIHIILFSLIFVGGAAFATITLQFTAGMEFRLAVTTVLRRVAKSPAFRQLVVIGFTVILLRFGLNNLMQTLAKFSLSPVQWDKTKLYYLLREVYQPLELLLFVAALCTISDAFLPSLIAIPKATVSHVVKSILSTSFIIGFATVVFNLKSRFCKENAWQAEMKGDATSQRRWEAYDKLGTFVIFVMSIVLGIQAMGLEVGSVLAIGGIGGLAIGLAGREICENLLSGFLIMSTNPFEVGDEVIFFHNNKVIEGIVADIGWYRTLIRSFEREMYVIPNAVFSKNIVLNVTRKGREWRLLETISIRVQDVQKANAIAQDIRRIMRSDTRVMNKLHRRVFVDKITKEDVQIYMSFYLDAANRDAFMAIKQDLMVSFVDCVERNGAKLATPRTVLDLDPEMVEAMENLNVHGYAAYAMARDLVAQKQQQAQMQPPQLPSPPVITAEVTAVDRSPPPPSSPPPGSSSSSSGNGGGGTGDASSSSSSSSSNGARGMGNGGGGVGASTKDRVPAGAAAASSSQGPQGPYTSATYHYISPSQPAAAASSSSSSQLHGSSTSSSSGGSSSSSQGLGYSSYGNSSAPHRVGDVYSTHTTTGMLQVPSAPAEPVAYAAGVAAASTAQNNVVAVSSVSSASPFSSASSASRPSSSGGNGSGGGSGSGGARADSRPGAGGSGDRGELDLSEEEQAEWRRVHIVGGEGVAWAGMHGGSREGGGGGPKGAMATATAAPGREAGPSSYSPSGSLSPSPSPSPGPRSSYMGAYRSGGGSGAAGVGSRGGSPARGGDSSSQAAKVSAYQQDHQARQARHQGPSGATPHAASPGVMAVGPSVLGGGSAAGTCQPTQPPAPAASLWPGAAPGAYPGGVSPQHLQPPQPHPQNMQPDLQPPPQPPHAQPWPHSDVQLQPPSAQPRQHPPSSDMFIMASFEDLDQNIDEL